MLEPLFRCNLACVGCGKIDYPEPILNRRLSVEECLEAVDECGAPMVAIPGGEPLIHRDIGEIVKGIVARKKFVSLCTNALLLEKKLDLFEPSPYLFFSVHLDGLKDHHDRSVSQEGVFDRAVSAIKAAKARGFIVNVNATIFDGHSAEDVAAFLNFAETLGVGVSMSPGYAYERAPDQEHFLSRRKTKELFRRIFALGRGKNWNLLHSGMYLDFLAGNQSYHCTPWGMPTRNIFGWQKPCYLLGEGYVKTFKELMETTDWDSYGTGRYEKCANCMAHCGYEPTAAEASFANPLKSLWISMRGVRTEGPMAAEISLDASARPSTCSRAMSSRLSPSSASRACAPRSPPPAAEARGVSCQLTHGHFVGRCETHHLAAAAIAAARSGWDCLDNFQKTRSAKRASTQAELRRSHAEGDDAAVGGEHVAVARQRPQREEAPVAVIAQVEHAREPGRGEARLVPEAVVALGLREIGDAALDCGIAGPPRRHQGEQRPGGLRGRARAPARSRGIRACSSCRPRPSRRRDSGSRSASRRRGGPCRPARRARPH